ncbi:PaaX family transcriptional regulator [Nocardia sp. NEAU-G5]|uniref:PaaX family transcriptional regulator n=1 Tax=Nocardia albiluteola TaxID=2842303 RepID=A0ABS6BA99_9NOCA|nr:PaaX family transcriptional regulator C-terminal domain-containing protein [Nocardia albiluteola]MBU3067073.1 PaaX family transcriptional regulator [Nocardia albiluteola]
MTERSTEDAGAVPALSRRREVGEASARSLLMTILGEFALPSGEPVWTSTLVRVLGLAGVEEKSARQSLARTAAEGWLSPDRVGRRVRWNLTDAGRRLLVEGAERIYSFGSAEQSWDGRWLVVLISIPESMRGLRHKLRTQFSWAGFGSPSPGVWITPHTATEAEARTVIEDLDLADKAMSFVAEYGMLGNQRDMVTAAWDLDEVERHYEDFIAGFADLAPATPDEILTAQIQLVQEWRRFPFLDPQLPETLLPRPWSGTAATTLFHDRHGAWAEAAGPHWAELAATDS